MLPIICSMEYSSKYGRMPEEFRNTNLILRETNRLVELFNSRSKLESKYKSNFPSLNDLYNEGFVPGLYIIGANPGVGKTSFCLQLADDFVQNNYDVIYCSLEMKELELVIKSISRLSYIHDKANAFTYNDIYDNLSSLKDNDKLCDVIRLYQKLVYNKITIMAPDERKNTFTTYDIRQTISNYYDVHKRKPVVIVDYLQLLELPKTPCYEEDRSNSRDYIMKIISEMKEFSRFYDIPIILISSVNRASYSKKSVEDLSLDCFKETGGIEYTADSAIVLTSDRIDDDTFEVNFNVLKNRFGKADTTVSFDFIPKYSFFRESSDDV